MNKLVYTSLLLIHLIVIVNANDMILTTEKITGFNSFSELNKSENENPGPNKTRNLSFNKKKITL